MEKGMGDRHWTLVRGFDNFLFFVYYLGALMALGLFVGMTTLDFIYLTPSIPQPNQKLVAIDAVTAAGGPATNAAVTFQYLGNRGRLLSAIGQHPCSQMIRADLAGLELVDLAPDRQASPPISSILVTESTGERAVISINATKFQAEGFPGGVLDNVDVVLIDGHQMVVGQSIAQLATSKGIPVVIDGGSWKPGFETLLPYVDYAICSGNFAPPGGGDLFTYLAAFGIPFMAITQGGDDILYCDRSQSGKVSVPTIQAVDTLGAGDIFHGAFCHFILHQDFSAALASAAKIAGRACESFGTRSWLLP
jgi:sugar/nucleoside kinase (ribokinase family)